MAEIKNAAAASQVDCIKKLHFDLEQRALKKTLCVCREKSFG